MEKDSPSSRTTKGSFFSRSAHFGNVSPFLVGATNTFSDLIHSTRRIAELCFETTAAHSTIYPKRLALSAFSLFEEQAGFVVVLPLPLIFDPPLYILHFTEKQRQKML